VLDPTSVAERVWKELAEILRAPAHDLAHGWRPAPATGELYLRAAPMLAPAPKPLLEPPPDQEIDSLFA
jgi:hypothetical protein